MRQQPRHVPLHCRLCKLRAVPGRLQSRFPTARAPIGTRRDCAEGGSVREWQLQLGARATLASALAWARRPFIVSSCTSRSLNRSITHTLRRTRRQGKSCNDKPFVASQMVPT